MISISRYSSRRTRLDRSFVWDDRHWVDEREFEYPAIGPEGIRKCPRRVLGLGWDEKSP